MRKLIISLLLAVPASLCGAGLSRLVNPFIGTGGHGHVFLGANVPFGFVQLGPTQHTRGWDWCSGYHYSDSLLIGFAHLHLSGTGVGDLGDVSLLPVLNPEQEKVKFSHQAEYVHPGYYSVMLSNGIRAELTATERTGLHRYTLPANATEGYLRMDLRQGIGWDKVTDCQIRQESHSRVGQACLEGMGKPSASVFCG